MTNDKTYAAIARFTARLTESCGRFVRVEDAVANAREGRAFFTVTEDAYTAFLGGLSSEQYNWIVQRSERNFVRHSQNGDVYDVVINFAY